jgi:hypothetical protein
MLVIEDCSASPDKNEPISPKAGIEAGVDGVGSAAGGAEAATGAGGGSTGAGSTTGGSTSAATGVAELAGVLEEAAGVGLSCNAMNTNELATIMTDRTDTHFGHHQH